MRGGRLDDALLHSQQALQADPLSGLAHAVYGNVCYFAGRLDEAEVARRKLLALSPSWLSGHFNLAKVLLARNDAAAALAEMQQEESDFWRLTGLALVHHAMGQQAQSDDALRELMDMHAGGEAYQLAQVHAFRGRNDAAFEWLERAAAAHDSGLTFARVDPLLRNLHADPRWSRFLRRNGLAVAS